MRSSTSAVPSGHTLSYRPGIDGLRALAILPVLFFHAGFAWIPGGFLGVDVFFVISGYLITSIIIKERSENRFSLAHFYERRARRILPALFFVLLCSSFAAYFILSPQQLIHYAQSLLATLGFGANIYFWQHIDYFTGNTQLLPLLHLWSLGIEEQFYFLFPLLFIFLWTQKQRLLAVIATLFVVSLLSAHLLDQSHRSAAFYLLPTRAWELIMGAACAFYLQKTPLRLSPRINQWGSLGSLVLLLGSFLVFTTATWHPSLWTLIPVSATAGLIVWARPTTWVGRLLSLRPLVWIGLLSYSAYLWHQPLFAFTRLLKVQSELGLNTAIGLMLLSFVLAAISWFFIEQPFRNRRFLRRVQVFKYSASAMLLMGAGMGYLLYAQGLPQRFNPIQRILFAHQATAAQQVQHNPCFLAEDQYSAFLGEQCKMSPEQPSAVMGDSHASALWYGLGQRMDLAKYTASGCAPLLGAASTPWRHFCPTVNEYNFQEVEAKQPPLLILQANWLLHTEFYRLYLDEPGPEFIGQQLAKTLDYLHQIAPNTQVIVVGDVPQWPPSLIEILNQYAKSGMPATQLPLPADTFQQLKQVERILQSHMDGRATFISLLDLLCTSEGLCTALVDEDDEWAPIAWDYGHLSQAGSNYVADLLLKNQKYRSLNGFNSL